MLSDLLRQEVFHGVFERSHFKKSQLDSLLVKSYARRNGVRVRDALSMKDKPVTLGSLERSASQAEGVISKSIATLILALSLGLIEHEAMNSISRVAAVLEESRVHDLSDEQVNKLLDLVDTILWKSSQR